MYICHLLKQVLSALHAFTLIIQNCIIYSPLFSLSRDNIHTCNMDMKLDLWVNVSTHLPLTYSLWLCLTQSVDRGGCLVNAQGLICHMGNNLRRFWVIFGS